MFHEPCYNYAKSKSLYRNELSLYQKILYSVVPVCENIMPSGLVSLTRHEDKYIWTHHASAILKELELDVKLLHQSQNSIFLLFYKKQNLEHALYQKDVLDFLFNVGYKNSDCIDDMLNTLADRYNIYDFPHEIGLFFGYPLKDVTGFIENKGRGFKACKYWKVYGNLEHSLHLFEKIDSAKQLVSVSL